MHRGWAIHRLDLCSTNFASSRPEIAEAISGPTWPVPCGDQLLRCLLMVSARSTSRSSACAADSFISRGSQPVPASSCSAASAMATFLMPGHSLHCRRHGFGVPSGGA